MRSELSYLLVGSKSWNRRIFDEVLCRLPGQWHFISSPEELTIDFVRPFEPRYIFFLHWSWRVPAELLDRYECVCFHMTDLPYGRGGSPLQNLILRGHKETRLTAFRMEPVLDAGPIYLKRPLSLAGNAEEIYLRATELAAQMIEQILLEQPAPNPQEGEVVAFARRKPADSELPPTTSLSDLYDFIRMLDAEGYPRAYIEHQGFRYEFNRAALYHGRIVADVTITAVKKND